MVVRQSTKGTSATMARNSSGARLATAPISRPPALPPRATSRSGEVHPSVDQVPGAGDEVGEGVRLGRQLPLLVPGAGPSRRRRGRGRWRRRSPGRAGSGGGRRTSGPSRPRRSRSRRGGRARHRPGTVGPAADPTDAIGPVDERDRDLGAVVGHRPQPLGPVAGGIEVAEHGLPLERGGLAGLQVEVVDGPWGDQRRVLVAQDRRRRTRDWRRPTPWRGTRAGDRRGRPVRRRRSPGSGSRRPSRS